MERKRLNRLKVVLAEKNMTNKHLAELVGKDPAMVSKLHNKAIVGTIGIIAIFLPKGRI